MKYVIPALIAVIGGTPVQAEDWALDLFVGATHYGTLNWGGTEFENDNGTVGGLAITRMNPASRLEFGVEIAHARNTWDDRPGEDQTATSLMATGKYTFGEDGNINGYAGLGLGVVRVGHDDGATSDTDDTFGGQFVLGARYKIPASRYQAFVEYRYLDTFDDATLSGGNDVEYSRQDVVLGIRLGF